MQTAPGLRICQTQNEGRRKDSVAVIPEFNAACDFLTAFVESSPRGISYVSTCHACLTVGRPAFLSVMINGLFDAEIQESKAKSWPERRIRQGFLQYRKRRAAETETLRDKENPCFCISEKNNFSMKLRNSYKRNSAKTCNELSFPFGKSFNLCTFLSSNTWHK